MIVFLCVIFSWCVNADLNNIIPCTENNARVKTLTHYVYDLDSSFREYGHRNCLSHKCSFGKVADVNGVNVYDTNQFDIAWLFFRRMIVSKHRTFDVRKADIFFVPMWPSLHTSKCTSSAIIHSVLLPTLIKQNELLRNDSDHSVARRHFIIDPRAESLCSYMYNLEPTDSKNVFDYFARVSLEKNYPLHHTTWPESMYGAQILQHSKPSLLQYPTFPTTNHLW